MTENHDLQKLTRKERERLNRRREILDAAMKLFAAKGYSGASMQDIAQASEFSVGALYTFFSTKEELYLTLLEEKFKASRQFIESAIVAGEDCLAKISSAVKALLMFMENNREFFTLFMAVRAMPEGDVPGVGEKIQRYYEKHVEFFKALMEEGAAGGLFGKYSPEDMANTLIGITNGWIYRWLVGPGDKSLSEQHEAIMDIFINGVGGGKCS